jgi:hypothetical protein
MGEAKRKLEAAKSQRHLFIGIPLRDRNVDVFTVGSLLSAQKDFAARGWQLTIDFCTGTHAIHHARNMLVKKFMSMPECTDMFFLDADVGAPMGAIMKLMDYPVDFVTALYRQKMEPVVFCVTAPDGGSTFHINHETSLIEVGGFGLGFCRVTRRVIETMLADLKVNHPDSWYIDRDPDERYWPIFSFGQDGHKSIGEDVFFYKRWQMLGGKCYADPSIRCAHTGPQAFTAGFLDGCAPVGENTLATQPVSPAAVAA